MAAKDPKSPKYCLTVGSNTHVFPFNLPGCSLACHPFTSSVFILPALALFSYVYIDFYLVFLLFSVSPSVCLFICIFVCVCVCVCILWVAQLTVNNPLLFGVCGSATQQHTSFVSRPLRSAASAECLQHKTAGSHCGHCI